MAAVRATVRVQVLAARGPWLVVRRQALQLARSVLQPDAAAAAASSIRR